MAVDSYTLVKPEVQGSIPGVSHKFRIVRLIIPACLIKQPNSSECTCKRMSGLNGGGGGGGGGGLHIFE